MRFITDFATTKGNFHRINQDCIGIYEAEYNSKNMILAFVCDGMGGEESGEKASGFCLKMLEEWFINELKKFAPLFNINEIKESLNICIKTMNEKLCEYMNEKKIRLGTTISVIYINPYNKYLICHVGDSRIYLIRKGIKQLTIDHINKEKNRGNGIVECVGITENINIYYALGSIKPNDYYIICSDGLYKTTDNREIKSAIIDIQDELKRNKNKITDAGENINQSKIKTEVINKKIKKMIFDAIRKGEKDNISIALINCERDSKK